ncbi:cytochrome P450 [Streptomyces yaizuensis]|uniref:Cytochrome P450 n=1 Tax=Streptomyces yaizuensis TaxID=2989713 RepID=A0ABQ5NT39_9ACTN|nr:cytochrome P450 [Streptomyces sp. YSPA8]GLF93339.1 cytochrome P450 [Streptomyces sp. YSPA8]
MTTPRPDLTRDGSAPVPPPGCPAHDLGPEGLHRLYGAAAESDPPALYELLRREYGPVAPVLMHGDLPAWLVLGHRENLEVMRTPSLFSRDSRRWSMFREGRVPPESPLNPMIGWQPLCVFADGDEHARLRGAVTDGLAQFNRHGIRRHVTRRTRQLVAAFAEKGEADLIRDYAEQLPMLVMTQLLGLPEENGPRLVAACLDLMKGGETAYASNEAVVGILRSLVRRKRERPGRDLASSLMAHASGLTEDEVVEHLRLVLVASNETTVNLVANTLRLVLTDRRFRASLSGGQMTLPDALEQVLWDAPPISVVPGRWATGDTVLGGHHIREGDMLLLGLTAGNTDPRIRPDLTAPVHGNRSHLAFSSGPHECPGRDIGRGIAETGIDTLLSLLPGLELDASVTELSTSAAWLTERVDSLPVRFAPRPELRLPTASLEGARPRPPAPEAAGPDSDGSGDARRPWWKSLLG